MEMRGNPPTRPDETTQYSPDGQFWWDGSAWVPLRPQATKGMTEAPAPKQPIMHVVASLFVPGLGTFLTGQTKRGAIILATPIATVLFYIILVSVTTSHSSQCINQFCTDIVGASPFAGLGILVVLLGVGWEAFNLFDAYRSAQQWNADHGVSA